MKDLLSHIQDTSIIAWIINNDIKTERGVPIDFDRFAFMIEPYEDWTPEQGSRKASQCGWSVMTNIKLFYAARYGIPGYNISSANVIYTLPSDSDVNVFVPSKTNLIIKNNPIIQDYLKDEHGNSVDVDSIQRKKIQNSMVYFKGTRSKTAAIMLTSDLNIHDEADRSEKHVVDEYSSRTAQSPYKGSWLFSNPSAPLMPADLKYLESDQKHWFLKCERCGHWQYLDWFKLSEHTLKKNLHCYIDDTNGLYVCSSCGTPITDENRKRGRWVKKYRDRTVSGYWVTHFMYSWMSAKEMVHTERKKSKAYFMNFVRGLPYVGSDVTVDAQTIVQNIVIGEHPVIRGKCALGVDNGDTKHWVLGDTEGIVACGKTRDWNDIELLIKKYDPITVCDLNPYPNKPRELAQKHMRFYCSFYILESKNYELIEWGQKDKQHMVYPVRNLLFDDMIAYMVNGNMKFFRSKAYWEEYISHWETMYRADMIGTQKAEEVRLSNPNNIVKGVWLSSTGQDHYCHATLFYYVALSKLFAAGGQVLQRQSPVQKVARELGGIPKAPIPGKAPHTIITGKTFIPDLSKQKPTKRSAAISGKM